MNTPALFHVLVAVFIGTCLIYWTQSSLPVSLTKILRLVGFRKHDAAFWPEQITYKFWIRPQWATWMASHLPTAPWPVALGIQLVTCPYCIAFHLSWIAAIFVWVFAGPAQAWWCVTYPVIALGMRKYLS